MTADRRTFLKSLAALPLLGAVGKVAAYEKKYKKLVGLNRVMAFFTQYTNAMMNKKLKLPQKFPKTSMFYLLKWFLQGQIF